MNLVKIITDEIGNTERRNSGKKLNVNLIKYDREDEDGSFKSFCDRTKSSQLSMILDMTWGGWDKVAKITQGSGIPYLRLDTTNHHFVKAADDYLSDNKAIDAALIFKTEAELDQTLYYLIGNSHIRIMVVFLDDTGAMDRLAKMRPSPNHYVAYGSTDTLLRTFSEARTRQLVRRDARWTMVFQDWDVKRFPRDQITSELTFVTMDSNQCCIIKNQDTGSSDCPCLESPTLEFIKASMGILSDNLMSQLKSGKPVKFSFTCENPGSPDAAKEFMDLLKQEFKKSTYTIREGYNIVDEGETRPENLLSFPLNLTFEAKNQTFEARTATWSTSGGYKRDSKFVERRFLRFFRIGTVPQMPWANYTYDGKGEIIKDAYGNPKLIGYCVEFVERLSKKMDFEYELVLPTDKTETYGKKLKNGSWTGLMGDLVNGEIDIAVAGMTMTSEREEAVDFVSPYFDQSGISIVLRKPVKPRSLFKFLEVLKLEVWMAILAALVLTALMLWFLDKYSPYSARNNKAAHPYPCREFTLKESFWFALTSFTPQGGGEAPKSMSGRVLVAAYWLFVVLMLATFTANLAAFLTVERMQTTVQSLEELAQQSKINYTVVEDSPNHEYFRNMAGAEEDLYK